MHSFGTIKEVVLVVVIVMVMLDEVTAVRLMMMVRVIM